MKMSLILLALVPLAALAAQKKPEMRQGSRILNDKMSSKLEDLSQGPQQGLDRSKQLEAKGPRQ